jgi:hypothetical protein
MNMADEDLIKQTEERLRRAQNDKDRHKGRLDDYYKYVMPWRHQEDNKFTDSYIDDIFDNTGIDACTDFAAEMLAVFTPSHFDWIDPVPTKEFNAVDSSIIMPQIEEYNDIVFSEIRRSNFAAEALEAYADLTHGTMAIMIVDPDASRPVHCEAIPANELLIARGPYKTVDLRAFDCPVFADQIPVLWPKSIENQKVKDLVAQSPASEVEVRQVMWRDYSDRGNEKWNFVAYFRDILLHKETYIGEGSCPLIVARWLTDSTTAIGLGPGAFQLPNIKTANLLGELILKNADYAVDPATAYDDDGTMNLEGGITPGTHIPRAPGSKIDVIESGSKFDVGYFTRDSLQESIKRGFYLDQPTQKGKTPPTAEQWLDEAAKAARRMGAPAGRLVIEWQYPIYKRFAYLLNKRGLLPNIKLNGEEIALNPSSPLIKQQQMEEALQVQRYVGVLSSVVGPEVAMQIINVPETAYFLKERMGIKSKILQSKGDINTIVQSIQAMMAAKAVGGTDVLG